MRVFFSPIRRVCCIYIQLIFSRHKCPRLEAKNEMNFKISKIYQREEKMIWSKKEKATRVIWLARMSWIVENVMKEHNYKEHDWELYIIYKEIIIIVIIILLCNERRIRTRKKRIGFLEALLWIGLFHHRQLALRYRPSSFITFTCFFSFQNKTKKIVYI